MDASYAGGQIPVFPYYELLQSTPSTGANESDRDYNNLNNTATMAAYYAFLLIRGLVGAPGGGPRGARLRGYLSSGRAGRRLFRQRLRQPDG
jgi:hypothetical protein